MFIVQSYPLAIAFCFITMLCWGSWGNTQKLAARTWRYELFYWDKKWISLGKQYAEDNKLIYQNIPRESIFRIHNHTRGKEHRPFTYEGGKQVWY